MFSGDGMDFLKDSGCPCHENQSVHSFCYNRKVLAWVANVIVITLP